MDSPELTRYAVLIVALVKGLLPKKLDPGTEAIARELDALTIVLARRARSAARYHETPRGKAALALAAQVAAQLAADPDLEEAELVQYRWSPEQAEGSRFPGMKPEERVVTRIPLTRGAALLSEYPPEELS